MHLAVNGDTGDVTDLRSLLSCVTSMKWEFSDGVERTSFEYNTLGEDSVGGIPCWKVEFKMGVVGEEETTAVLWISEQNGSAIQAMMDDETFTGPMASYMGAAYLGFFANWFFAYSEAWDYNATYAWSQQGLGTFTFLGSEQVEYGPTTLLVYKYRFTGLASDAQYLRYSVEVWTAPTQFGTLATYIRVTELGGTLVGEIKLDSISFTQAPRLPQLSIGSPQASKTNLQPGESFTISVPVSNMGVTPAMDNLTLLVDGTVAQGKFVTLAAGGSQTVTFTLSITAEGTHTLGIGGKSTQVTVSTVPPASFSLSNLMINPTSVTVGGTVTVSATVKNTGGTAGSCTASLKVNGQQVDQKEVTLNPDQSTTVTFTIVTSQKGTFSVALGDLGGSYTVTEAEAFPLALVAGGAVVLIVIAGGAVFFLTRKKQTPSEVPPPPPT